MSIPQKAEGFVSRTIAGDVIIVPVRGGVGDLDAIFTLNGVGATIWKHIDGGTSVERLAALVAREYEVAEATARDDVGDFLELLGAKGLITSPQPATGGPP